MEIYRTACLVAKSNFMRWKKDGRILLTFLLMIVLMIRYFSGLSSFGIKYHTKITPFLLSVVFADCDITNGLLKILVCFGWVCLLCDVPVRDPFLTYIVLRSGRKGWWLGENIYICASAGKSSASAKSNFHHLSVWRTDIGLSGGMAAILVSWNGDVQHQLLL